MTTGYTYYIYITAINAIGESDPSSVFSIIAATVPGQPAAPIVAMTTDEDQAIIQWEDPLDNGGLDIYAYQVKIITKDGDFIEELTYCDASNDPTLIAEKRCTIPADVLRVDPFNLNFPDEVYAKVLAINAIGPSLISDQSNGEVIQCLVDRLLVGDQEFQSQILGLGSEVIFTFNEYV